MDNSCFNTPKDELTKRSPQLFSEDMKKAEDMVCSESLTKPKHLVMLVNRSRSMSMSIEEVFLRNMPKHILSVDEKFLRRCLEVIYITAAKSITCSSISLNLSSLSENSMPKIRKANLFDSSSYGIECSSDVETRILVGIPIGHTIIGSITEHKSMINILSSPLYRKHGVLGKDHINIGKDNFIGVDGSVCSDTLRICSPEKLGKDSCVIEKYNRGLDVVHNRLSSISSASTSCSYQTSTSVLSTVSQGMLQCTWNSGIPYFIFSINDQTEIYVANILKNDNTTDYMYSFYLGSSGTKKHEICTDESKFVGKMKVSTCFKLCPANNSRIMETEYVLLGVHDNDSKDMQTSSHHLRNNSALSRKVANMFKPRRETRGNIPASDRCRSCVSEDYFQPNNELAAIIFKEHFHIDKKEAVGGWGLNFLKKDLVKVPEISESCLNNTGEGSTRMDILVPAGIHGGPRTRNGGGPSGLIERWRSGGHCDCGGWDTGCPLTVLNTRLGNEETLLFVQDKEAMKLVKVHDGLYNIQFKSILSALQSFSIAVAIIHTQSPQLHPKYV